MNFLDMGAVGQFSADLNFIGVFIRFDGDKRNQALGEKFGVQSNFITVYNILLFKFSDSFQNRRWGQSDPARHIHIGNTGFFL